MLQFRLEQVRMRQQLIEFFERKIKQMKIENCKDIENCKGHVRNRRYEKVVVSCAEICEDEHLL